MQKNSNILSRLDWVTVMLWAVMMIMGWLNIYAAVYNENHTSIFDLSQRYGKQLLWIVAAVVLAVFVIVTDNKLYFFFAWFIYGFFILLLLLVLVVGKEINGARAWFEIGPFSLQPSEFAKVWYRTCPCIISQCTKADQRIQGHGSCNSHHYGSCHAYRPPA